MKIFNVPIEPLEERYSAQWGRWFPREFRRHKIPVVTVTGPRLTKRIEHGSFLDIFDTNQYKAHQMAKLVSMLRMGMITPVDWIFFHDLWFPGIQSLAYIRDLSPRKFKIAGCLHAGTWDKWDLLTQSKATPWAKPFERSLLQIADLIFVATEFHRHLIIEHHGPQWLTKIKVTGFPIYPSEFVRTDVKRVPNLVVFPHRLCVEKGVGEWERFQAECDGLGLRFLSTKIACDTKAGYYTLLAQATYALSFAKQETWGIAMQEALFSGCIPLVMNDLSYREMYPPILRHDGVDEALQHIRACYHTHEIVHFTEAAGLTRMSLERNGREAIPQMIERMQRHGY